MWCCTSVTMEALSTNFMGGKGVAALHCNCSMEHVCPVTICSRVHISLCPVCVACWVILERKKCLSINVLLMYFYEVQCFKRMWYSEVLYQELNGSDSHPYNVSRFLLIRRLTGCPSGPACNLWERQGAENLKLLLTLLRLRPSHSLGQQPSWTVTAGLLLCVVLFSDPNCFPRGGQNVHVL